jgi:hypothetical protein
LIAGPFHFAAFTFFQTEEGDREVPQVDFSAPTPRSTS